MSVDLTKHATRQARVQAIVAKGRWNARQANVIVDAQDDDATNTIVVTIVLTRPATADDLDWFQPHNQPHVAFSGAEFGDPDPRA